MPLDVVVEDPRWADAGIEPLAIAAVEAVFKHFALSPEVEVTLLAASDARIAGLNAEFRGKPTPTNVLSWPSEERAAEVPGTKPAAVTTDELGDLAIAYETCAREAVEQGKPFDHHVTHLFVHGTLHLLGYDHIHDADAVLMEATEIEILGKLGIEDPY